MRYLMDGKLGQWIITKLLLQLLASFMIIWFPHRIVLMMFTPVVVINGLVVINNMMILFSGIS